MYSIFERLLRERGVTVADVCKATGIRQSTLSNWKKRNNKLSAKNAELIADFFDVSVDYLMGRKQVVVIHRPDFQAIEKLAFDNEEEYYLYKDSQILAREVFEDDDLHALLDAARGCSPEDLKMARDLLRRLKETNHNG